MPGISKVARRDAGERCPNPNLAPHAACKVRLNLTPGPFILAVRDDSPTEYAQVAACKVTCLSVTSSGLNADAASKMARSDHHASIRQMS